LLGGVGEEAEGVHVSIVRDLVLWLKQASKPRRAARTKSAATAGTVKPDHLQASPW
jgi:hypothetical protein